MNNVDFERFVSSVSVPALNENEADYSKCWEWQGRYSVGGYGIFYCKTSTTTLAHRVIYEHIYGKIIPNRVIHHKCNNKRCVNPIHLDMVTHAENTLEGGKYSRSKRKHCRRGHLYTKDTLKEVDIGRGRIRRFCLACYREYEETRNEIYRLTGQRVAVDKLRRFLKNKGEI